MKTLCACDHLPEVKLHSNRSTNIAQEVSGGQVHHFLRGCSCFEQRNNKTAWRLKHVDRGGSKMMETKQRGREFLGHFE